MTAALQVFGRLGLWARVLVIVVACLIGLALARWVSATAYCVLHPSASVCGPARGETHQDTGVDGSQRPRRPGF